jgi:hypothetical protein
MAWLEGLRFIEVPVLGEVTSDHLSSSIHIAAPALRQMTRHGCDIVFKHENKT